MSDAPVTLITGARKGIGRFLAERYVKQGHHVIGCSRKDADFKAKGYTHHLVDVTDEAAATQMFAAIAKEFGRLDNLISNAGIAAMNHAVLTPMKTVNDVLSTNVAGTFLFAREAARLMQKKKYGRIVNFTSVAVPLALEGEAIYAASKAAVASLTEILARELAPMGITVNAVGPTPVETDLVRNVPKDKMDALLKRQALPRMGTMDDVANVVDFYLSRESGFVTGQVLYLGGVS
jgi:3-oxoacyl-[acyl-carrier protein] reductase